MFDLSREREKSVPRDNPKQEPSFRPALLERMSPRNRTCNEHRRLHPEVYSRQFIRLVVSFDSTQVIFHSLISKLTEKKVVH